MTSSSQQKFRMEDLLESYKEGRREGLREGRRDGRQVGRREGAYGASARILLSLLAQRFGESAAKGELSTLGTASVKQLALWSERVLAAETIEDVFR